MVLYVFIVLYNYVFVILLFGHLSHEFFVVVPETKV